LFLVAQFSFLLPPAAAQPTRYTLGVVPSFPPVKTYARWTPFVEMLAQKTGLNFKLKVYEQMVDFERDIVSAEAPDFIFANALQITVAHQAQGYLPLVRASKVVWGVIFVRQDSPVRTLADLEGLRVAFVGAKNL
jgi:phosphonate transport system substrate-binding protein